MRLRSSVPWYAGILLGLVPVVFLFGVWVVLTWGAEAESRIMSPVILPSPWEVVVSFPKLWFDRGLSRSVVASLIRVGAGFGVASVIAVPLGIAMGAWGPVRAMFNPVAAVGGYLPIAALVPLTMSWFGTTERQKIAFLALAAFVFLLPLVIKAVDDVDDVYLKTAYTLGATPLMAVWKVLIPIALAKIYDGLRLAFGIGWTYIILAEIVDAKAGLGNLIIVSQRRGPREHIYWVLIVIILLAFTTDMLFALGDRLFFRYRRLKK